ncbi:LysR substrate-binding domain-containing protein [Collimonas sp.]|jgi:DNA-binding transcriptional LysR family regulator|uniref:LysR substrate-binding domain-containing protein n=1 Tax=Collimonas sp. TaxID=1963772 RepID=UPI002C0C75EC|nr:LysR substrate-binding domain-containing protein [Collimonas sp.]HWW07322.1 LysR substrate-binding domain-containing protein [Collimonas sp.]
MQIKWIEDFLSLSEAGAFSRAAGSRNVSQPTLSRHIQSLEDWLGAELIDRRSQGVTLTPAGRLFRNFAADMLRRTYEMRTILRGQTMVGMDTVRFSVTHTLASTFFPRWLKQLKTALGPVTVRVGAVNIQDGAAALIEGVTDLLLIYHHPQLPVLLDPTRYPHLVLANDRMLPLSAPDEKGRPLYKLPGKPEAAVPFLAYSPGTYLAHVVEMILLSVGQRCYFERSFDTHMALALKAMVIDGHGLGWLPESCAEREISEGKLVPAGISQWNGILEVRLYRAAESNSVTVDKIWASLLSSESKHL